MDKELTQEEVITAILKAILETQAILKELVQHHEQLGQAIELLAEKIGCESTLEEDARA